METATTCPNRHQRRSETSSREPVQREGPQRPVPAGLRDPGDDQIPEEAGYGYGV